MKLLPAELADMLGAIVYNNSGRFYSGLHGDTDVTEEIETATRLLNAELANKED
jgi:hypothetical protein